MSPLFEKLKIAVLGKSYDLSFAYLPSAKMRAVAKKYKHTDHVSNVLSFPLSKTSGEILICKSAGKPFTPEFLFIHGLLHLKGIKHGCIMERKESELLLKFGLPRTSHANDNGHRRRNLPRQSSHRRAVR